VINATFYVFKQADESGLTVPAHFDIAAQLAAECYRNGQRVFIYATNQQDAHLIDEHLWQFEPDSFVPHNLQGEGQNGGAPVEIGDFAPVANRKVLINLSAQLPDFIARFSTVYDFVPFEESQKLAARERYKQLRQFGATLRTQDIEV
jgi:DNA polymerase-3 subunit chi